MAAWSPSDTIAVVSVCVSGASVIASVGVQIWDRRRREAEDRDARRRDDLRAWRDRTVPALARLRTEFANHHQETAFANATVGDDPEEYLAWLNDVQADVVPVIAQIAAGHPDATVRQLAVDLEGDWQGYFMTTSSTVHMICRSPTAIVWEGVIDGDQMLAASATQKLAAGEAVTRLTEAIHAGIDP